MSSAPTGFTDRVRKILESAPGVLHSVAAIEAALGEHAPPKTQPIYNALHELVKTGEIRRIKKPVGNGSNYYWPNDPDEHQTSADIGPAANKPVTRAPKYDCPPALTQAVNAMRTQNPVSHPVKTVLDYDPGTRSASFTRAPQPALARQEGGNHYKDLAIQPIEFIQANGIGFCEGNVIKYITRWKQKNGIEELKKARHYIDLLIELEHKKERGPQ